jgi:hypothetical protein
MQKVLIGTPILQKYDRKTENNRRVRRAYFHQINVVQNQKFKKLLIAIMILKKTDESSLNHNCCKKVLRVRRSANLNLRIQSSCAQGDFFD